MNVEQIKKMMDACYLAKRVREMLPKLPQGVAPSYIQYLDVIQKLERQKGDVKVSDISDVLELPRPGKRISEKNLLQGRRADHLYHHHGSWSRSV